MGAADDMKKMAEDVTKKWTKQRKAEERRPAQRAYRVRMIADGGPSQKDVAYKYMEDAYRAVAGPDNLPATARQIMYAIRPKIQKETARMLSDSYFTQTLLPDYIRENDVDWNVVWDQRGHIEEPHSSLVRGLGTLEVREYLDEMDEPQTLGTKLEPAKVKTIGPDGAFGAVLFIEKEGFLPLFHAVNLPNRFDIMVMSTKGMSVVAARKLLDDMCGGYNIPVFVLHDFDPYGFSIYGTLKGDNRRYEYENEIDVYDIGLRLTDVNKLGLEGEWQTLKKNTDLSKMRLTMLRHGATKEECDWVFQRNSILRVELNALTSGQLIDLIERRLTEYGVKKIVPDSELMGRHYQNFVRHMRLRRKFKSLAAKVKADAPIPDDLEEQVDVLLTEYPTIRWDRAIEAIADPAVMKKIQKQEKIEEKLQEPDASPKIQTADGASVNDAIANVLGDDFTYIGPGGNIVKRPMSDEAFAKYVEKKNERIRRILDEGDEDDDEAAD
jgi:hypothetical protein